MDNKDSDVILSYINKIYSRTDEWRYTTINDENLVITNN